MTGLLLLLVSCVGSSEPPPNATTSPCEAWTQRKSGECAAEVMDQVMAMSVSAGGDKPVPLQPFSLRQQCELFPERTANVAECVAKPTCAEFAGCVVDLGKDGFVPSRSPGVCEAFVRRGGSGGLKTACNEGGAVRAQVGVCMGKSDDDFPACASGISR